MILAEDVLRDKRLVMMMISMITMVHVMRSYFVPM